ncbi:hypothetical protein GGI04_000578 [Coemansia thaxteri]|uniref:Uncharacterized protein n=1 Tax=Coemansia thaxteri TaxID=2663907 RepID=A0A9W8EHG0_9FUNG|nr:hypothetical protein H4R26_000864 [Coemansia thaxteri]KAJ2009275.1 hypothetical protein GGI04_000578 [Coemansia thaxteri]KAJ2472673.1 hypothetical protein GGI02_001409 [Coemansia sp. RSA 2322]KAJ2487158.1 hypothetical protein EV174_000700 [Coemansia sp. RSA 2320]
MPRLSRSRPPAAHTLLASSSLQSSGQCTPPDDASGQRLPSALLYSAYLAADGGSSPHAEYTVVAPVASYSQASSASGSGAAGGRAVASAIQIGDPEWRVDSPQSAAGRQHVYHQLGKLPSPVSPVTPPVAGGFCSQLACSRPPPSADAADSGAGGRARRRPLHPNLGLSFPSHQHRMHATARSATLGSACLGQYELSPRAPHPPLPARVVTPAERVARLHAVSGLAARAVARRCLSAHTSVLPAGLGGALGGAKDSAPMAADDVVHGAASCQPATACNKPTFADVARSSQDHHQLPPGAAS